MQIIVTKELESSSHIWLKSLTRSMDQAQAEALLDSYERLPDDDACKKAEAIVNLVSDVNDEIFLQIISGGGKMSEALKEMILPELEQLKMIIANREAELAESRNRLADKDAIIAELRRELAEIRQDR